MPETFLPIQLPSKCLPYPDIKPSDVMVRPYNGEDEMLLAQINPANLGRNFLSVMQRTVKGIDPARLTLGDRFYMIIWQYINSYCEKIKVKGVCSHCMNPVEFDVDLRKLNVTTLPDSYHQPVPVVLPVSSKTVNLRLLTVADEIEVEKYQQQVGDAYLYRWARSIDGVDPVAQTIEMKSWPTRDTARVRLFHEEMDHGPDSVTTLPCPKCKQEEEVPVPFRLDLLLPVGSALRSCFGAGVPTK